MNFDMARFASYDIDSTSARQGDPAGRGSEFQAVDGGGETMNGNTLMVEAYAFLWVVLFAFIWWSWRIQGRIDARVAELERSLAGVPRGGK